jgi:hypothetical protein
METIENSNYTAVAVDGGKDLNNTLSVETKTAARKRFWMTLSLWCMLFVVCGYGLLRIFGLVMNAALFLK